MDIVAHLTDIGLTEEEAVNVVKNIMLEEEKKRTKEEEPFANIALMKIGGGIILAIISAIIFPGMIVIPVGLILGGILYFF